MAMTTRNLTGMIDGETISGLYKHLDRSKRTYEERHAQILKGCYKESKGKLIQKTIFESAFEDERINVHPNSNQATLADCNVVKFLDACGSYLLNSRDVEKDVDKEKIVVKDSYEMKKAESRTQSLDTLLENDDTDLSGILIVEKNDTNFKKQIKQVIYQGDYKNKFIGEMLCDYQGMVDSIDGELRTLKAKLEGELTSALRATYNNRVRQLSEIKSEINWDMVQTKDQMLKTIYFKQITSSFAPEVEYNGEFDYWDKELIRLLAKVRLDKCRTDYAAKLAEEFLDAYDQLEFDEESDMLFTVWKNDKNLQDYADYLGENHKTLHKRITGMLTLVQRKMIENYELDVYYTEFVKGKWKTCSKCGEVKIANEYYFATDKTCKDGFKTVCKVCKAEMDKNK